MTLGKVRPISVPDEIGISYVHVGHKDRKGSETDIGMTLTAITATRRQIGDLFDWLVAASKKHE